MSLVRREEAVGGPMPQVRRSFLCGVPSYGATTGVFALSPVSWIDSVAFELD